MPQRFSYAGREWKMVMRFQRRYLPFSVTLIKFSHDIYPGTTLEKNFSSRVRLNTPGQPGREVLIYMNNPLRTGGLTFYQKSFGNEDRTTVLQVVRNPSWVMPYIACSMMALGLVLQFGQHLAAFARRRRGAQRLRGRSPPNHEAPSPHLALILGPGLRRADPRCRPEESRRLRPGIGFGRLPVLANGRIKPMDTVARTSLLLQLAGKQKIRPDGQVRARAATAAIRWRLGPKGHVSRPLDAGRMAAGRVFLARRSPTATASFTIDDPGPARPDRQGRPAENLAIHYAKSRLDQWKALFGILDSRYRAASAYRGNRPLPGRQSRRPGQAGSEPGGRPQRAGPDSSAPCLQLYEPTSPCISASRAHPPAARFGGLSRRTAALPAGPAVAGVAAVRAKQAGQLPHDEDEAQAVLELRQALRGAVGRHQCLLAIPPEPQADPIRRLDHRRLQGDPGRPSDHGSVNPSALAYAGLGYAWRAQNSGQFNQLIQLYRADLAANRLAPEQLRKSCDAEVRFNAAAPVLDEHVPVRAGLRPRHRLLAEVARRAWAARPSNC